MRAHVRVFRARSLALAGPWRSCGLACPLPLPQAPRLAAVRGLRRPVRAAFATASDSSSPVLIARADRHRDDGLAGASGRRARRPRRLRVSIATSSSSSGSRSTTCGRPRPCQPGSASRPRASPTSSSSHIHWDHADGADLFPRATVWIQREEFEHYVGPDGAVLDRGDRSRRRHDAASSCNSRRPPEARGRRRSRDSARHPRLHGRQAHVRVAVRRRPDARRHRSILASDNAYLYENLEKQLAIAQTLDAASNLAAQARMLTLAAAPKLVVPGHDPAVFERFPAIKPGVVRID